MIARTLQSFFTESKQLIQNQIVGLSIPQDIDRVHSIISDFFDKQLSPQGDYASQLSEPEFYILQSSMFWRKLQNQLYQNLSIRCPEIKTDNETTAKKDRLTSTPMAFTYSAAGGLLLSTCGAWATLAGSLAGLIVSTFLFDLQPKSIVGNKKISWIIAKPATKRSHSNKEHKINITEIDAENIMKIVEDICKGVDDFILTVSNQISRLIPEESSLIDELGPIIIECQKFIGRLQNSEHDKESISFFEDIWQTIGIEFMHYSKDNSQYFLQSETNERNDIVERYPAVLIDGKIFAKGSVKLS